MSVNDERAERILKISEKFKEIVDLRQLIEEKYKEIEYLVDAEAKTGLSNKDIFEIRTGHTGAFPITAEEE